MNYVVVTNEWLSEHGIMPLPTMRKSKGGSKVILHEDYFNLIAKKDEEGNLQLGDVTVYGHNSEELKELLLSEEWGGDGDEPQMHGADYIQVAAVRNLMTATKAGIQTMSLSNSEINQVVDMLPQWKEYIGESLSAGTKIQHEGKPYKVIQDVNPVLETYPPGIDGTMSIYGLISGHDGTKDDPIPYVRKMVLESGQYYSQNGVTYLCKTSSGVGYDADLTEMLSLLEVVE